ncbi:MAG TPA: HNH endonuclease [Aurantimonas coralicida]|uniref:HNH endonuclease n=1 Tax=Aurantimonas coralicida TaxID=182270 RepID=A0A9C9TG15_9HYPH|nr:HNH endonuclease [Aurantimonas coralicida]HET99658.1 HNH endonuclease [Aurantimonas coralicida]
MTFAVTQTPEQRFFAKIQPEPNSGCWLWDATIARGGYGHFWVEGRLVYAHRFSYELVHGPIPPGAALDHLCSVPSCVNPDHLEAVTPQENAQRTVDRGRWHNRHAAKTHCPYGHPYSGDNLYFESGYRRCRACSRRKAADQRRKRRAA